MLRSTFITLVVALAGGSGCSCDPPVEPPPDQDPVGRIAVDVDGETATVSLTGLSAPLRALQVGVFVNHGQAKNAVGAGPWNVVEAGLVASAENPTGGPKDLFTLVVADTRRLSIGDGAVAVLTVDSGATVALENAVAVDVDGAERPLTVVAR
jgi:hypothetical protein